MKGGKGMTGLAREVMTAASCPGTGLKPLYDWSLPVEEKIGIVAREIYGAAHIDFTPRPGRPGPGEKARLRGVAGVHRQDPELPVRQSRLLAGPRISW
jgi:hypothetical protein